MQLYTTANLVKKNKKHESPFTLDFHVFLSVQSSSLDDKRVQLFCRKHRKEEIKHAKENDFF